MTNQRRVILYGDSLILEGIRTNLHARPDLEIVSLTPPLPSTQALDQLSPDVMIFDLAADRLDAVLALLHTRPQLLLVGVDLATNQMLLWSGEHSRALAMQDLVQAIDSLPSPRAQHTHPVSPFTHQWTWIANLKSVARLPSRQRALALAAVVVGLCAVLVAALTLIRPTLGASLVGAAAGGQDALGPILAFTAGIVLGGALIGWWLRRGKHSGKKESHTRFGEEEKEKRISKP